MTMRFGTTSPGRPTSFSAALKENENGSRSVSSVSKPTIFLPRYRLSGREGASGLARTTSVSGEKVMVFSDTSPKSNTITGLRGRLLASTCTSAQYSSVSTRERSTPPPPSDVRMDRQRRPAGASVIFQEKSVRWVAGSVRRRPPMASGYSVSQSSCSGERKAPPAVVTSGSICSRVKVCALPLPSTPLFCQARVVARVLSSGVPPDAASRLGLGSGRLPKYQAASASGTWMPPSPSNDSTYACPAALGWGRLVANSPLTSIRDGAVAITCGSRSSARVSGAASKVKLPLTPATSDDAGSRPSGGRLKAVFCDCEIAVKLSCPFAIGNCVASPKMEVGAVAKSGFSS